MDDNIITETVNRIMQSRRIILDDFCEAYLAENMKHEMPSNLVLNEQMIDGKYRWWFSVKDEEYMK